MLEDLYAANWTDCRELCKQSRAAGKRNSETCNAWAYRQNVTWYEKIRGAQQIPDYDRGRCYLLKYLGKYPDRPPLKFNFVTGHCDGKL